jgi:hypothetical protein
MTASQFPPGKQLRLTLVALSPHLGVLAENDVNAGFDVFYQVGKITMKNQLSSTQLVKVSRFQSHRGLVLNSPTKVKT